jgi:hypothetical protein
MTQLSLSSVKHDALQTSRRDYFYGSLPGTLQYNVDPVGIKQLHLDGTPEETEFQLDCHTRENYLCCIPNTPKGRELLPVGKLLLVMKGTVTNTDTIWVKTAIYNQTTHKIALLTSTNNREAITGQGSRALASHVEGWYVGHYRMLAPLMFWQELQNRLLN